MTKYVALYAEYEEQMRAWATEDDTGAEPSAPKMPWQLRRYLECQIGRCLLVSGGLSDQPHWTWLQLQVAGDAYHEALQVHEEIRRVQAESARQLAAGTARGASG